MPFRYLRDPLFLACFIGYFLNRFVIKHLTHGGFFHDSFNDLICIPFWVPIMLWGMRRTKLRPDDAPPRGEEILIPLLMWSYVFEIYLPRGEVLLPPRDLRLYGHLLLHPRRLPRHALLALVLPPPVAAPPRHVMVLAACPPLVPG